MLPECPSSIFTRNMYPISCIAIFASAINFLKKCTNQLHLKDAKDGLLKEDSALTILMGTVCQKWNVSSVIANSRLVQEFKTKIWRLNQAPAKAKTQGVTNGTFITMGNSSFWQRACLEQMSCLRGQIFGMLPAEPRIGQFKFPARQPDARLLFFKLFWWEDFTPSLLHSLPVLRNPERGQGELPYEKKRDGGRKI